MLDASRGTSEARYWWRVYTDVFRHSRKYRQSLNPPDAPRLGCTGSSLHAPILYDCITRGPLENTALSCNPMPVDSHIARELSSVRVRPPEAVIYHASVDWRMGHDYLLTYVVVLCFCIHDQYDCYIDAVVSYIALLRFSRPTSSHPAILTFSQQNLFSS